MEHYFNLLKQTLMEHNLKNFPAQIHEYGVCLDPKAPNIVTKIKLKN